MSVRADAPEVHSRNKLLRFPATSTAAQKARSRLKKYGLAAAGIVLVVGGGIALGLWGFGANPKPQYITQPLTRGSVTRTVTATGTVNPVLTIIVGTYVSGVIQELFCDYNTEVKAGQICAKIDPRPFQATLDQYAGQLMRDQAILDKDRANLARYQQLLTVNSISRQQVEDQTHLVAQDEGTVKLDEALVEGAKLNLAYTDIISPVDGTVVSRNVTQGQTVAASFQTPTLFLIATDLKKMQVDTNTSESDIGGVKEGDNASFTVDAFPNRMFNGTVSQVRQSPQSVQNVITYDAVVSVDNSDFALKPGMTASTRIVVARRTDTLRVPNQALRYVPGGLPGASAAPPPNGQMRIWLLRDGEPVGVDITVGLDDGNYTEVIAGDVKQDDRVIVAESGLHTGRQSGAPQPRL